MAHRAQGRSLPLRPEAILLCEAVEWVVGVCLRLGCLPLSQPPQLLHLKLELIFRLAPSDEFELELSSDYFLGKAFALAVSR